MYCIVSNLFLFQMFIYEISLMLLLWQVIKLYEKHPFLPLFDKKIRVVLHNSEKYRHIVYENLA